VTVDILETYGWGDRWAALLAESGVPGAVAGRVVRHDGVALALALPDGVRQVAFTRALDPAPAVGDWVVVADGAPVAVLPRTSLLTRRAAIGESTQQVAANVDGVLVVCGLDRPVRAGRIDRFVTLAWDAGAVPTVVLTKADLIDDPAAVAEEVAASHPGVDVVTASVVDDHGIDDVRALVAGRTFVLVGESGAGKSSLTNALLGDEIMAIGEVRAGDAKGRHTTTTREAHPLRGGGVLIDTPGVRAVGLTADPDAVAATYADVDELAAECRFSDCGHEGEPGCAVALAVEEGRLAAARLDGWRALEREAAAAELRAAPHLLRARNRRFGRMVKDAQRRKGRDR
jgi:ribosome biogenesis GTPase